jgi:hypothetical protein
MYRRARLMYDAYRTVSVWWIVNLGLTAVADHVPALLTTR